MNFRIDMPCQEVLNHCKEQNFRELLLKDEFHSMQTKTGKQISWISFIVCYYIDDGYANFKEADITFAPTYKFDLRSGDTYANHRTPSYTVRIKTWNH